MKVRIFLCLFSIFSNYKPTLYENSQTFFSRITFHFNIYKL
jgi:hypothetical protein